MIAEFDYACFNGLLLYIEDSTQKQRYKDDNAKVLVSYSKIPAYIPVIEESIINTAGKTTVPFFVECLVPGTTLHVLALDCDTAPGMAAAKYWLESDDIATCVIESSPGHFWVIGDLALPFNEMVNKAKRIPGVDKNFVAMMKSSAWIRAMPKGGFIPKWISNDLKNPFVISWVQAFQSWWESPFPRRIAKLSEITSKLAASTLTVEELLPRESPMGKMLQRKVDL